jgi:hypothetical protein
VLNASLNALNWAVRPFMTVNLKRNLLNELRPPGVSVEEFLSIVALQFGSSAGNTETNVVLYPAESPHELRIEYSKKGDLTGIFALPGLSESKLENIRDAIQKEFVDTSALGVNRRVFFSYHPVFGWWRYQNRFQILPVPPHAPRVSFLLAEHPFLIEYVYPKADNKLVDVSRRVREAGRLRLLLNGLLQPWVRWIGPSSAHHWVLTSNKPEAQTVEYLQEFYTYKDLSPVDSFTAVDNLPKIVEVAPEIYYYERRRRPDAFEVPSDLAMMLDRFFALDEIMQDRFLHACYWLSQSSQTSSFSSKLLFAVQAIEALTPLPTGGKQCPTCGLATGPGPTKAFNTFLEVFLPDFMKANKALNSIYTTRSALTHGSRPLLIDTSIPSWVLNPLEEGQRETADSALRVTRMCLRNWLSCEPFIHGHVEQAAYFLWQKSNQQYGHDKEHWLQAITDLRNLTFLNVSS